MYKVLDTVSHASPAETAGIFLAHLDVQSHAIPEIAANAELIAANGQALITDPKFGLEPSLFDDPTRSLIFSAIANYRDPLIMATRKRDEDDTPNFVRDSLVMLALQHSSTLGVSRPSIDPDGIMHDRAVAQGTYDKYTDIELTESLVGLIDDGLLDDCKKELGITTDNEDPYIIHVLDVDTEPLGVVNRDQKARAQAMAAELEIPELPAAAWVQSPTTKGEPALLFMTAPLVVALLKGSRGSCFNTLKHEYTHTQGSLTVPDSAGLGIPHEERRADYFGKGAGYMSVANLFIGISDLTGFSINESFARKVKGGECLEHHQTFAQKIGLNAMLETMACLPSNYIDARTPYHASARDHVGGYAGIRNRLVATEIAKGNPKAIENHKRRLKLDLSYERAMGHIVVGNGAVTV